MIADHMDTVRRRFRGTAILPFTDTDFVRRVKGDIQITPAGLEKSIYFTPCNARIRGTLMC